MNMTMASDEIHNLEAVQTGKPTFPCLLLYLANPLVIGHDLSKELDELDHQIGTEKDLQ